MGGAGKPEHLSEALQKKQVSGVITANLFNFRIRFKFSKKRN